MTIRAGLAYNLKLRLAAANAGARPSKLDAEQMEQINHANADYWNEPCGTTRLEHLGVSVLADDASAFAAFDDFFFEFYPYLELYIPFGEMSGRKVLEVGLGMGSVSQRIAATGAAFTGLDIAQGPVDIVNRRLALARLPGTAQVGSILAAPFADQSFDFVVSIGCLHHTGDPARAIAEIHRLLKPGGTAVLMLYYAYSPKRWLLWPRATWRHLRLTRRDAGRVVEGTAAERAGYDRSTDGGAPPETIFTSRRQMRHMTRAFSGIRIGLENLDTDLLLYPVPKSVRRHVRPWLLRLGKLTGVASEDMYAVLRK